MARDWTTAIASERMELDGEFADRITASSLSPQQWNLVMTAVSFEIENPGDPEHARLVANTDNLAAIEGELDRIEEAGPGGDRAGSSGGGFLSRIFGGDGSDDRIDEAETMAGEYATRLQEKLGERGRWAAVCERAAAE